MWPFFIYMTNMLRKFISLCVLLVCNTMFVWTQNIRVEGFNRLDTDISARANTVLDANDDPCALIKMVTTDKDYDIDGYIKRRDDRVGELWFYLPQGTKQIVIRHKRLGKLVYQLPEVLKEKLTYQLMLPSNVEIVVHEDAGGQYLVMTVEPAEATVYIDGIAETLKNGRLQKFLRYGAHTYRVEAPLHQSAEGTVEMGGERRDLTVKLLPDYGYVRFSSTPEEGASVYLNGQELGKTPFTSARLAKGIYSVSATLPMHAPVTKEVTVEAGKTAQVTLNFSANYGTLTLTASDAAIYVDNELKGTGSWTGRLSVGLHRIETRKAGHRSGTLSLDVVAGQTRSVALPAPEPMYASLNVSCAEVDARVYIDGKDVGTAPNIFKVLSGTHTVELKNGVMKSQAYQVNLTEGEMEHIDAVLDERIKVYTYKDIDLNTIPCKIEMDKVLATNLRTHEGYSRSSVVLIQAVIDNGNAVADVSVQYNISGYSTKFYKYSFEERKWSNHESVIKNRFKGMGSILQKDLSDGTWNYGVQNVTSGEMYQLRGSVNSPRGSQLVMVVNQLVVEKAQPIEQGPLTHKEVFTPEAVDLGLSVKWASCNVGATKPEEYGEYYAWGETEKKEDYSWETYKWCKGTEKSMTKYCTQKKFGYRKFVDNKTVLDPEDDVAHVKWGEGWRMPTKDEFKELREKCIWEWTTQNGVNGYSVKGPNGNSIFLPAAGHRLGTHLYDRGSYGYYWSATLGEDDSDSAFNLYSCGGGYWNNDWIRDYGHTVRPVTE